jgi:hypothetical protein
MLRGRHRAQGWYGSHVRTVPRFGSIVLAVLLAACDRSVTSPGEVVVDEDPTAAQTTEPPPVKRTRPTSSAGWTVSADELGTVRIRNQYADAIRGRYAFFGPAYKWAGTEVRVGESTDTEVNATFDVAALGVSGTSKLVLAEANGTATATMEWDMTLARKLENISGGGIELQATLNLSLWGGTEPKPQLSADGRTLSVGVGKGTLSFTIDGPGTEFVQVPGKPGLVRIVLLGGTVPAGKRHASLTVTLPDGGTIGSASASGEEVASLDWPEDALVHDGWPVDLSFLQDKPAGKHGHVKVVGESLQFADGTPARFFGTNLVAYALFEQDKATIQRQAKRISAMGFNLVRLHHHDSGWVKPNIFERDSRRLRLESLDWWIKCLADEGIYIWLDLHVGRVFREDDGIGGFSELPKGDGRGFNYVSPRITALMDEFASAYLDRTNKHTGRTIAGDPAVAIIQITNENDITHHFGTLMDPGSERPVHEALFRTRVEAFAKKAGLPVDAALQPWKPGPAKLALADIEHKWSTAAIAHVRKLGVRVPISTTSMWGDEAMYSMPSLVAGDVIDVHSYGNPDSLSANPHIEPNFVSVAGMAAVLGKPHTASEFSVPPPAPDRFVGPTYMAAMAAFQGWDAPLLFAYAHEVRKPQAASRFSVWIDPALIGPVPAAAVMYRRQDVAPAKKRIVIAPTAKQVYGEARNVLNSAALRTGLEQSQVVIAIPDAPELSWDRKPDLDAERKKGATIVTDLDADLLPKDSTRVVSDTGQITREFVEGRLLVATPRSQLASGKIGGAKIELADGWVELENPSATFAFTALDDDPIATSKRVLVTAVGPAVPSADNRATFRSAPIRGRFAIRTREKLELVPLAATTASAGGSLEGRVGIAGKREGDVLVFELDAKVHTHWWILRPAK